MSGGSPVGGGSIRLRYSQGYASSGSDLEDDACSRPMVSQSPSFERKRNWVQVIVNLLWIGSSIFIIYYGDRRSNLISVLLHDIRIRRIPLYLGMLGVGLNLGFFLYSIFLLWGARKSVEKWEISCITALPCITILAIFSFSLFSFALWPIWSFLSLPLVFTLFMTCMVILPSLVIGTIRQQTDELRSD